MTRSEEAIAYALLAQRAYTQSDAERFAVQIEALRRATRTGMEAILDWIFDLAKHPASIFDAEEFFTTKEAAKPHTTPKQRRLFK